MGEKDHNRWLRFRNCERSRIFRSHGHYVRDIDADTKSTNGITAKKKLDRTLDVRQNPRPQTIKPRTRLTEKWKILPVFIFILLQIL